MRLLELKVSNFRGFGGTDVSINLNADLVLIFGPNGFGKTSLTEAVEWLFYGTTKRRERGEQYSKAEYNGTFANAHGGLPAEVQALVRLSGRDVLLARRLKPGEATETFVDGVAAPFSSIGLQPIEAVYPVVAQHGLQTFIHTKPKERRDALCAALGLDDLTSFKRALDSARTSFQRTPPATVVAARRYLAANASVLARLPATADVGRRWQQVPPAIDRTKDGDALLAAASDLTGHPCTDATDALGKLREQRASASRSVFDDGKVRPADNWDQLLADFSRAGDAAKTAIPGVEKAIAAVVAAAVSTYGAALLSFWQTGLGLAPTGDECPMCEAPTLTEARRAELQSRLNKSAAWVSSRNALGTAVEGGSRGVLQMLDAARALGLAGLEAQDVELLKRLMPGSDELAAFIDAASEYGRQQAEHVRKLQQVDSFLQNASQRLLNPEEAPEVVREASELGELLSEVRSALPTAVATFRKAWSVFDPVLATKIASDSLVASIDAVGKSLRAVPQLDVLTKYDEVLSTTQKLLRDTEGLVQKKQSALLATRGAEVQDCYKLLNGETEVGFAEMEPGTDSMKIHAKSFGVKMPAAANLSECQLNCLGLSVWLMRATTPSSPFGFVMLDDPVQSMDDDHAEAFMANVVPRLLDTNGKQVIILSHVKFITQRLRALNQHRDHRLLHLESYDRNGPTVVEQAEIHRRLAEIKGGAKGNESNRETAVDRMRVLVEHVIREIHLKLTGQPVPAKYDRATPDDLLQLFRTIPGTTQQEYAGLKDTVGFCDPAHHSEVGYSAPQQTKIMPHIDRIEQIARKHGVLR